MISRADGSGLVCALTFDDGPNGNATSRLLDFLELRSIRAVFCLVGERVRDPGSASLVRRMVADGHVLANHTYSHADLSILPDDAVRDELSRTLTEIREALDDPAASIPYFRAPYGRWGGSETIAAELGMTSLAVVNTIADWETQDDHTLAHNLRRAMRPGELLLAHDGGGARRGTVDAVIAVVDERLAEGWTFTLPAWSEG